MKSTICFINTFMPVVTLPVWTSSLNLHGEEEEIRLPERRRELTHYQIIIVYVNAFLWQIQLFHTQDVNNIRWALLEPRMLNPCWTYLTDKPDNCRVTLGLHQQKRCLALSRCLSTTACFNTDTLEVLAPILNICSVLRCVPGKQNHRPSLTHARKHTDP